LGINNHSLRNKLLIALAAIFLASNLGIAKVSHYCRMVQASVESDCCGTKSQEPSCCNPETEKNEGCCTNQVQIFKVEYQSAAPSLSTLKFKATNVETVYGTHVQAIFKALSRCEIQHWTFEQVRPPGPSPTLLYSVFLI
jgi:hypothetical protein